MLAAVILTVGLLALSGMQGISLGRNVDANELSRVANLASDIIERIQFNRRKVGEYNNINVTATALCPTAGMGTMALGDCNQWRQLLINSGLSGVQGQVQAAPIVTTPTLNQTQVTVTVSWVGSVNAGGIVRLNKTIQMNAVVAPE
jgi:type IV pilus assembly protein PilV